MPSASARFNVADDPWVDVRAATRYHQVGLREFLLNAHHFDDLAVAIPPAASALLRIAVAITARITGLDDPDLTADEWTARRRALLAHPDGFDPTAVNAYFNRHHFEVFDPVRPWLQDPALSTECDQPTGINRLIHGRPAGNNLAWFSPHTDTDPAPIPTAEALHHLLIHHYYGPSGCVTPRTARKSRHRRATAGPLRSTISFHPLGNTLYETLLAGIPKFLGDEQTLPDHCPWEEPHPPEPHTHPHPVTWPGRLLTGRSRHAILLIPGDDGTTVTNAYLTWATQHPKLHATDPYLIITTDPTKPIRRRRTPRRADADRAWWRELDTLLLAPDEQHTSRRPEIFDTLNDLPPALRRTLRIRIHAFDQDTKTLDRLWYTAITPPLLNWTQEHDPQRAERIAECCRAAEQVAARLTTAANHAWRQTLHPHTTAPRPRTAAERPTSGAWTAPTRALYWELAEPIFWRLLDDPDTPADQAFIRAAATALRQVTETARIQHRAAGRAVALAIAALRRTSTSPKRKGR
jgi:CRISPR system Cascade subunit CasA